MNRKGTVKHLIPDDWMTAEQIAREYHVGRSTAYAALKRMDCVRIGRCIRVRRSEVEGRMARYGRI